MKEKNRAAIMEAVGYIRGYLDLAENLIAYPPALMNPGACIGNPDAVPFVQSLAEQCDAIEAAINDESQSD